jgi:hypothetical protein
MVKPFGDIKSLDEKRNVIVSPYIQTYTREAKPCELAWLKFRDMLYCKSIKPSV